MDQLRILIIAPDPLARAGLATIFEHQDGCLVVGQAADLSDLPSVLDLYRPDVGLVDLGVNFAMRPGVFDLETDLPPVYLVAIETPASPPTSGRTANLASGLYPKEPFPLDWIPGSNAASRGYAARPGRAILARDADPGVIVHAFYVVCDGLLVQDPRIISLPIIPSPVGTTVPVGIVTPNLKYPDPLRDYSPRGDTRRGEMGKRVRTLEAAGPRHMPLSPSRIPKRVRAPEAGGPRQGAETAGAEAAAADDDNRDPLLDAPIYEPLTERELEVLSLIAEGLPNKRVAQRLGISEHTVKYHINTILGKLGAESRTEAVTRAARLGWLIL